jgi:EF-hand domain-containing protein 1
LGYIYRLIPKPPKKDFFRWVDNQVNLRFYAVFNTDKPEDVDRAFIITYYLNDDTLMVYEPTVRNSGRMFIPIVGIPDGKYLEKRKYKNPFNNNEYFTPADLVVGNDVQINGWSFKILQCDDFTKKWYAQHFAS